MDLNQWNLIQDNMGKILDFLVAFAPEFLQYLEEKGAIDDNIRSAVSHAAKFDRDLMFRTLKMLKELPNGWTGLRGFTEKKGRHDLLILLEVQPIDLTTDPSVLAEFTSAVAQHYLGNFGFIPSHLGGRKHVRDFWVPLKVEDKTEREKGAQLDHFEVQKRLAADISGIAVVKGDPGTGKTTLVKKICYDWALQHGKTEKGMGTDGQEAAKSPFSLILAVPLRSAVKLKFDDYVQLAVDFFADLVITNFKQRKAALIQHLTKLGGNLLVILDGLDEYAHSNFKESPIAKLFAPPFDNRHSNCNIFPELVDCKVMITSRPYALEQINQDFHPLRIELCSLDTENLKHFVNKYCESEKGRKNVFEYLKGELVIKIPLILTFICYLAENKTAAMPTSLTLIYEQFIGHMIVREKKGVERLKEQIMYESWKKSELAKTTGKLALLGCTNVDDNGELSPLLEFDAEIMKECGVAEDSFNCGFLLDKVFVVDDRHKYDFPHRSIQEFFAALYCYQQVLKGCRNERNLVAKTILNQKDSQFGRFLFGICSNEKEFDQMSNWLQITFADIQLCKKRGVASLINSIDRSLTDCSEDYQCAMGKRLLDSLAHTEANIAAASMWNQRWYSGHLECLNGQFFKALRIAICTENVSKSTITRWYLTSQLRLTHVVQWSGQVELPQLFVKEFNTIELFMWNWSYTSFVDYLCQPQQLPPVSVFQLLNQERVNPDIVVTVNLQQAELKLRKFRLEYHIDDKLDFMTRLDQFKTTIFTIDYVQTEKNKCGLTNEVTFFNLNVTVKQSVSQSVLLCSLLKLALEVDYTDTSEEAVVSAGRVVTGEMQKYLEAVTRTNTSNAIHAPFLDGTNYVDRTRRQMRSCILEIQPLLPQIRSMATELKVDMVEMLLRGIQLPDQQIDNADYPTMFEAIEEAEQSANHHDELRVKYIAQIMTEMQICTDTHSPYRNAVGLILSHLSLNKFNRSFRFHNWGGNKNSVLMLLNQIVLNSSDKSHIGQIGTVEVLCNLIGHRLNKNVPNDVSLKLCWMCLNNVCQNSTPNQQRFLEAGGICLFRRCYNRPHLDIQKKITLVEVMMRLIVNLKGETSLCQLSSDNCASMRDLLWNIWCQNVFEISKHKRAFEGFLISFRCATVLINLVDSEVDWPLPNQTIGGVEISPFQTIIDWRLDAETFLDHLSFKNDLANMSMKSPEHQLVILWKFANCTVTNVDKYCPLLREENAIQVLTKLIQNPTTSANMRDLANLTISNINIWSGPSTT